MTETKLSKLLYVPNGPFGYTIENGIYIQNHESSEYKKSYLKEVGLGGSVLSFKQITGKEASKELILDILKEVNTDLLLQIINRLSMHISHEGVRACSKDKVQRDVFISALNYIRDKKYTVQEDEIERLDLNFLFAFEPAGLGALTAIILRFGIHNTGKAPSSDTIGILISAINDLAFGAKDYGDHTATDLYIDVMKQSLTYIPLLGSAKSLGRSFFRTNKIYENAFHRMSADLKNEIDQYIKNHIGLSFNDLMLVFFPLCAFWLLHSDKGKNCIIDLNAIKGPLREKMHILCKKISTTIPLAQQYFAELEKQNDSFFIHPNTLKFFVQHPLVSISDEAYVLLAPFFLTRKMELAVENAFFELKPKKQRPEDLRGPSGEAFEDYVDFQLKKVFPTPGAGLSSQLEKNPSNGSEELCDFIIDDPEFCLVFETKFRPPPIRTLDLTTDSNKDLDEWLFDLLVINSDQAKEKGKRRGALWQLDNAVKLIRDGARGFQPKRLIPVLILSEDFISPHPIHSYVEKLHLKQSPFCDVIGVSPWIIMSITELENLCSVDYAKTKWSFVSLIAEKSEQARYMNWTNFLTTLNLPFKEESEIKSFTHDLVEKIRPMFDE